MFFRFTFAFCCFITVAAVMASSLTPEKSKNETETVTDAEATTMPTTTLANISLEEGGISLRAKRSCGSCCGGGSCCGTASPCASTCCSVPSIPISITAPVCACGVPGCSCGGCACGQPGCSCNGGMPSCACGSPGCSCGGGQSQSALLIPIQTQQTCCRCCQPVCAPACMQGGGCYTGC
uniref:Uncharacterized protein n=1 Tax=Panagrolaimus superbus TaxID=310955 RepID=A0A914Z5J3_9BILA